jgi:methylated-DNA-[protein]-cysteine S-methyltransferase
VEIRHTVITSPIGPLTLAARTGALCGLYFAEHKYQPPLHTLGPQVGAHEHPFAEVARQLADYFAGRRTQFDVPLALQGNEFYTRVWQVLLAIPHGQRTTYGAIAAGLGNPRLAQAVGSAVGHNPVSIIVPCHRVVGRTGNLTGYAGGLDRKRFLLALEEPTPVATLF